MSCDAHARQRADVPDVITRFANVIYWACCVLALIWLASWLYAMATAPVIIDRGAMLAVTFGGAAVIWMIGRAIRYVMIGK